MPADSPLISVVVPAFNELATIEAVVRRLQESLAGMNYEIVIVDDCSTDGSSDLVRRLNGGPIRSFCHGRNQGKGAALRTAMEHVSGEIVVIQDADLEYDPRDIPGLVRPILEGHADVVYGSRYVATTRPVRRRIAGSGSRRTSPCTARG